MKHLLLVLISALLFTGNVEAGRKKFKETQSPFSAKSFLVASEDGTILREHEGGTIVPIASISKLMVGILAADQDLSEILHIPTTRQVQSSIPRSTATLSRRELLTLALVKSDNFAAQILCNNILFCVERMNSRALELGMTDTKFQEPTGLDKGNVSTAHDLLKLVMSAVTNSTVSTISSMPSAEIATNKNTIKIRNTNPLTSRFNISLSKTGFTNPAGGCLVMVTNSGLGQRIFILLGSRNSKTRIPDMVKLVKET
jgi:serine-type D-Ala-D-Ala endopeptidase (penicillin-binding protein 7)